MRTLSPLALVLTLFAGACTGTDGDTDDPFDTGDTDPSSDPYAGDSDYTLVWAETDTDFPYDTSLPIVESDTDVVDTDTDAVILCDSGYITDCNDNCFSGLIVGDGYCDQGPAPAPDFSCEAFNFDEDDCEPPDTDTDDTDVVDTGDSADTDDTDVPLPTCTGAFEVNDCNGACYPATWVGDGRCDQGSPFPYGSPDFDCSDFDFDMGDCELDTGDTGDTADTDPVDSDTDDTDDSDSGDTDTDDSDTDAGA